MAAMHEPYSFNRQPEESTDLLTVSRSSSEPLIYSAAKN